MANLQPVLVKLNWARKHFDALERKITEYINSEPSSVVPKPNSDFYRDGAFWTMAIAQLNIPIPDEIPLLLGDVFSNLRSCLDYLIWELVRANGNQPNNRNAFPICDTQRGFRNAVSGGDLTGVSSAVHSFIETLQPYHLGKDVHTNYGWSLNEFTNINKHRRLLVAQLTTSVVPPDPNFIKVVDGQAKAVLNPPTWQPQTEFGPFRVVEGAVKVNTQFMAYVTFDEAPAKGFEILSFVEGIFSFVFNLISHCEQHF